MTKWLLILITVLAGSLGDILCAKGMSQGGEHLDELRPSGLARPIRYIFTHRLVVHRRPMRCNRVFCPFRIAVGGATQLCRPGHRTGFYRGCHRGPLLARRTRSLEALAGSDIRRRRSASYGAVGPAPGDCEFRSQLRNLRPKPSADKLIMWRNC